MGRNTTTKIEVLSDHFLPCALMGAEWEARYNVRARRL